MSTGEKLVAAGMAALIVGDTAWQWIAYGWPNGVGVFVGCVLAVFIGWAIPTIARRTANRRTR